LGRETREPLFYGVLTLYMKKKICKKSQFGKKSAKVILLLVVELRNCR
jgi:hypothetical protein